MIKLSEVRALLKADPKLPPTPEQCEEMVRLLKKARKIIEMMINNDSGHMHVYAEEWLREVEP
jgi:dipeptidyl aminopeptidase/acylaminoacyl peptidase